MTVEVMAQVKIAGRTINAVNAIEWTSGRRNIADTGKLSIPMKTYNKYNDVGKMIARGEIKEGDTIAVSAGYRGYEQSEFFGYISKIERSSPAVIYFEDKAWHWKQSTITKIWNSKVQLKEVLHYVSKQYNTPIEGNIPELTFEKFRIENKNGYEFLQTVREQWGVNAYFRNGKLYAELLPELLDKTYKFHYGVNISGIGNLKKRSAEKSKVQVKLKSFQKDNTFIEATAGETGGSVIEKIVFGISNKKELTEAAKAELASLNLTGYEGSIEVWAFLPLQHSAKIEYVDADGEKGIYVIDSVKFTANSGGFGYVIELGKQV